MRYRATGYLGESKNGGHRGYHHAKRNGREAPLPSPLYRASGMPSTPKRGLEFTVPRNKASRTGHGSQPSTPRTSTQSSTEHSTGEWETATEEKNERRKSLISGPWNNESLDRKKPPSPKGGRLGRRGIEDDVISVIENQAARLGDLSIENKKLKQAVEVGK